MYSPKKVNTVDKIVESHENCENVAKEFEERYKFFSESGKSVVKSGSDYCQH